MNAAKVYAYIGPKRFYHSVFWAIAIASNMVDHVGIINRAGILPYLGLMLERNGLLIVVVYLNFYCLIPKLFTNNKVLYWTLLLICMALFSVVHGEYRRWLFTQYNIGTYENAGRLSYLLFANFLNAGRFVLISVLLKFTVDWFDQQKELTQAKVDKLQAELKFLKNQINPHFLFNTLNNLYALSLQKSDKTPDSILRLSEMMEYMLYESNEDKVRLIKDIEHLDNFIALERIRSSEARFSLEKYGEIKEQMIAPFLLLPLVENVFKHGFNSSETAAAKAKLTVEKDQLLFEVENKTSSRVNGKGGTGLENLRKRLNHIYCGKHSLQIKDEGGSFHASLKIDLR